ncbi:PTS mannose transporter subunit IID [Rossellomorea aquimaris]|uniref:PTS mannose transporter subunit IID n=1 Tax=Rossellomorea aquimaris TaxID=189382 RepID=UPI0011E8DDAF|nr:PTS mannose transporter subunit IID [Rossellomorea aquimaris]TYS87563.1 PTS mannose transporter subunit IID [Rossellomorea aquimaris]
MKKDIFTLLGGFLTSVFLFLGTIGVSFDWFTQTSIDAFVFMAAAAGSLVLNLYAVWKNTHVRNRLKKNALKKQELTKK